jgi:putative transposase
MESKRRGPAPKLGEREIGLLREAITAKPVATLAEINAEFHRRSGVAVSLVTLRGAMQRAGIQRVMPAAVSGFVPSAPIDDGRYGYRDQHRDAGDAQRYGTSLTDAEWALVAELFDWDGGPGKPPRHGRRAVVDACFYVVRTGCAWRLLPKSFPPWNAVYKLFRRWSGEGRFEQMHDRLRQQWRMRAERPAEPSTAILDSQSTRSSPQGGIKGFDAGKRVKGRKRNLVVDTLGLLLAVVVTAASVQDRDSAEPAMAQACAKYPSLQRVFVDSAYAGRCAQTLQQAHAIEVHVVRHPANRNVGHWQGPQLPLFDAATRAYARLPKRWIVERSHAWLERARRLVMHHDRLVSVSEAWVWLSEARRLLRGLAHP